MFFSRESGKAFYWTHQRHIQAVDPPQKMLSVFRIFCPKKVPSLSTHELPLYGDSLIQTLIGQFGSDLPAKSLEVTEFEKVAIVSSDFTQNGNIMSAPY